MRTKILNIPEIYTRHRAFPRTEGQRRERIKASIHLMTLAGIDGTFDGRQFQTKDPEAKPAETLQELEARRLKADFVGHLALSPLYQEVIGPMEISPYRGFRPGRLKNFTLGSTIAIYLGIPAVTAINLTYSGHEANHWPDEQSTFYSCHLRDVTPEMVIEKLRALL
jgi:hypothetical protein